MIARERDIRQGIQYLTAARNTFRACGAHRAADYAARALKSAEGALRHAEAQRYAQHRKETASPTRCDRCGQVGHTDQWGRHTGPCPRDHA